MQKHKSYIWVTQFNQNRKSEFSKKHFDINSVWFHKGSLLMESVKEIMEEAYTSESQAKYIVIETKKIPHTTQNALLKVLEEPPKNIYFVIIVPSKSILLPTVLSRLTVEVDHRKEQKEALSVSAPDLKTINLKKLKIFLSMVGKLSNTENLQLLDEFLTKNRGYNFREEDLERLTVATKLLNLHSNSGRVFLMLLLPFVTK